MCDWSRHRSTRVLVTGRQREALQNDRVKSTTATSAYLAATRRSACHRPSAVARAVEVWHARLLPPVDRRQLAVLTRMSGVSRRITRWSEMPRIAATVRRVPASHSLVRADAPELDVGVPLGHLVVGVPAHDDEVHVLQLLDQGQRMGAPDVAGAVPDVALPDADRHVLRRA